MKTDLQKSFRKLVDANFIKKEGCLLESNDELTAYELWSLEKYGNIAPGTSEPDESYDNEN